MTSISRVHQTISPLAPKMSKKYFVCPEEFAKQDHPVYSNLNIRDKLGTMERMVAFLQELATDLDIQNLLIYHYTHGGYIPMECASYYPKIYTFTPNDQHRSHLQANINEYAIPNIITENPTSPEGTQVVLYDYTADYLVGGQDELIVILPTSTQELGMNYKKWTWDDMEYDVFIHQSIQEKFEKEFSYCLHQVDGKHILTYDNLIHFCMIIKNGGEQLEQMLLDNAPYIDRWTILDTGSTDQTVEIIDRFLKGKRGKLYRGEFTNFGETRNVCLDYAERQYRVSSKYVIMLDDTYVIQGKLREFLKEIRGDTFANSLSLYVSSHDCKYVSNRIIKMNSRLRYKYKIHEVMEEKGNVNVVIPEDVAYLLDRRFDYMEKRTMDRKQRDIKWLEEEINDNPTEPRHYYYMAQTYHLLGEYEKAFEYFGKRAEFVNSGFIQERIDAVFEMARLANFQLNRPWSECQALYEKAYQIDDSRPESLYYLGIHSFLENQMKTAYPYFKKAFALGFPEHCQHSLKPTLSFHYLPKFLAKVCYHVHDYTLGIQAVEFFLKHNPNTAEHWHEMVSWHALYQQMIDWSVAGDKVEGVVATIRYDKPILVMVADGGFAPWNGSNLVTQGVGGSETFIIEVAQEIQKIGYFQVIVFCRCLEDSWRQSRNESDELRRRNQSSSNETTVQGVEYRDLTGLYSFVNNHKIHTCIVSRYTAYLAPLSQSYQIENLYLILHDLVLPETIIIQDKLKRIFCLSEWHTAYFKNIFPTLSNKTETFSYGIDFTRFTSDDKVKKIPYSFIYSSYPERGLLPLLQCWPRIVSKYPQATLNIFSNVNNEYSNEKYPEQMQEIKKILRYGIQGIHYHGWVNKSELAEAWKQAEYWFYPCIFQETFCLTALEAAASKTLAITNGLAALENTAAEGRAIVIPGDPATVEWQDIAINTLYSIMDKNSLIPPGELIEKNYEWSKKLTWQHRGEAMNEIVVQEKIEYRGMFNWTHGLPTEDDKTAFLQILDQIDGSVHILEVGVWSGTSLIRTIQTLQARSVQVKAMAIDAWANYEENGRMQRVEDWEIEKSFDHNIRQAGLEKCVEKRKGKSTDILKKMNHSNQEKYDFIYIDGSHRAFWCFADLILAWELLKVGGIMGIDDYLYREDNGDPSSPLLKQGVDAFLEIYQKEIEILHQGYRVFIKKREK